MSQDSLSEIDPYATAAYLKLHGWDRVRAGELGDRWQLRAFPRNRNVALPHPELEPVDRALMMSSALLVLEEVEQRSISRIARDLLEAGSDIIRFRVSADALQDGEMPLSAAPEMLTGALEAIRAAGRAEIQTRAVYSGGQVPTSVKRFVDLARVGPTERGSVVLHVRSKVTPVPLEQTSLVAEGDRPPSEVPFERRVLRRLLSGIRAGKTAVHREAVDLVTEDALDEDIEAGLSANLCDALAQLAGEKEELGAHIEVGIRWSLFLPSDEPETRVEIGRSELDSLADVARRLRLIVPLTVNRQTGFVKELKRDPGDTDGTVRVLADLDGRSTVIKLFLAEEDYKQALQAHEQNRELIFSGVMEKAGKVWEVAAPTEVELRE